MAKETKKYTLFSNGTEFMVWQTDNCEKCVKAVWFNEKTNTFPAYRCTIQRDIELACVTDGFGIKRVYDAVQKPICPYRQDVFYYAYLDKNNLLMPCDENKQPTEEEDKIALNALMMQQGIEKKIINKAIENM